MQVHLILIEQNSSPPDKGMLDIGSFGDLVAEFPLVSLRLKLSTTTKPSISRVIPTITPYVRIHFEPK